MSPESATAARSSSQVGIDDPASGPQDIMDEMSIDQEQFISLNWPDSEDLLNSILSTEFANLPSLEILPSQSIVSGAPVIEVPPASPWLTSNSSQSHVHGGNHAVQNLSHIITSLVGFCSSLPVAS